MPVFPTTFAAVALGVAIVARQVAAARRERECARRLPVGSDGIVIGAAPFELAPVGGPPERAKEAVLLLHGFGDTPAALRYLGEHLAAQGWTVRAPLLPGHGRSLRDFARSSGRQWLDAAREELAALRQRFAHVHLVGLSMGGALAAALAAEEGGRSSVRSLTLLAPYLDMPRPVRRLAVSHRLLSLALPYAAGRGERSIHDPEEAARSLSYGTVTPRLLHELLTLATAAWQQLPRVTAPVLYMQSLEDNRLTKPGAESAFERLGSSDKRLEWLEGCGHIITVDHQRERVFAETARWIADHGGARATPRSVRLIS